MNPSENPQWQYKPGSDASAPAAEAPATSGTVQASGQSPPDGNVSWTSAEYVEHDRGSSWYLVLMVATLVLSVIVYFITKDYFATGVIPVIGGIVGFAAGHKPRQLEYEISDQGLRIGTKSYPYTLFKSFSVIQEGPLASINLVPIKRLMPMITAYFAPGDQERITKSLGNHLPYEERQMATVDKLSHRLRF